MEKVKEQLSMPRCDIEELKEKNCHIRKRFGEGFANK